MQHLVFLMTEIFFFRFSNKILIILDKITFWRYITFLLKIRTPKLYSLKNIVKLSLVGEMLYRKN